MAIAFVQAYTGVQFNNSTGGTTGAKTLTAGNFLGVASTGSVSTWTTTTTPSGTVAQANAATVNNQDYARLQYQENVAGGSTTVTLAIAAGSFSTLCCAEWSGLATSSSLDQHNITTGSSATLTSPSVTTTQADELLLGHGTGNFPGNTSAWTAGASYTVRSSTTDDNTGGVDLLEDRIVASTGTYNATATKGSGNGPWVCGIATFKAASGSSPQSVAGQVSTLNLQGVAGTASVGGVSTAGQTATVNLQGVSSGTSLAVSHTLTPAVVNLQGVSSGVAVGGISVAGQTATLNLQGIGGSVAGGGSPQSVAGNTATLNLAGVAGVASVGAVSTAGQTATLNLQGVGHAATVGGVSVAGQTAVLELQGVTTTQPFSPAVIKAKRTSRFDNRREYDVDNRGTWRVDNRRESTFDNRRVWRADDRRPYQED